MDSARGWGCLSIRQLYVVMLYLDIILCRVLVQ